MYQKTILYISLIYFFIGCSASYQSNGVAMTKDIYPSENNTKDISLIVDSFIDEIDKSQIEKLIISDLKKADYHISTQKPYSSTKLYVDLIELKSLITTQNSHFSFYNFWYELSKMIFSTKNPINPITSITEDSFKGKRKKDFNEVPVYILISKIKIVNDSKVQKTKIIAEDIQNKSKTITLYNLEKKLSSFISTIFKGKNCD
jgi:hypothetical protein